MTGAAASLAVALVLAGPAQVPPRFEVSVETVHLDVVVAHAGRPVLGLQAENFVVSDNGVRQRVRLVDVDEVAVAAVLVFDTSGSLASGDLDRLREGARALLRGLREGDRAALVTFADAPRLRVGLTPDVGGVLQALEEVRLGGRTALYDGLYAGLTLPPEGGRSLVVLFTDGEDNGSWLGPDQLLLQTARSEGLLQVVGVERDPDLETPDPFADRLTPTPLEQRRQRIQRLEGLALATGGRYWRAKSTDRLEATFLQILREMTHRYLLAFEPEGVERQGVHELDVRLEGARGQVRARTRYLAGDLR